MKTITMAGALALLAVSGAFHGASAQAVVQADGSSTVFPVTEAMAEEFQKANPNIKVTVGLSGTGGGFKKFCRGETDISNASRPITAAEQKACKEAGVEYIELPVALDALTVIVHPSNDWASEMTVAELKTIWQPEAQGKITNWKQVRSSFPDKPLVLYGAGVDSGTYDYFTAAIVGKEHSSRGDFTASEDDNVLVQGVAGDPNALGFFGLAYFEENADKLKAVKIKLNDSAPAVEPNVENARTGKYQPLSRPIFIYVSKKAAEAKPEVAKFVEFYQDPKHAVELVKEVGYVPLPEAALKAFQERFAKREIGTGFTGSKVGVSVEDLLKEKLVY
ncbi:PstS family phosphate ABC transporter substrate-binding protein [Ancylobacter sp. TS-1]|uniref:PstS family phosphate ABC transporter substrate-binding protein n=1 Tax=Ancylobacter sp. TS-1 TaxID=1850374 RepID=UPI001265C915|nr:PstS family phosphate ABC transporter substrate-binding protein [Ancylobacter sp. TS-1]QFR34671.1 phosphate ABC transporter substrate-binding protein PstS family protein [Ancylobacter sp. TS-1]